MQTEHPNLVGKMASRAAPRDGEERVARPMPTGGPAQAGPPRAGHAPPARPMSQENVEVVRRVIDAFNRRDLDAAARYNDDGVESTGRGPGESRQASTADARQSEALEYLRRDVRSRHRLSGRVHRVRRAHRGTEPNALLRPGRSRGRSTRRCGCDLRRRTHRSVAALPGASRSSRSRSACRSKTLTPTPEAARASRLAVPMLVIAGQALRLICGRRTASARRALTYSAVNRSCAPEVAAAARCA